MDGLARCAKYAFGPNRLHLCGPDANQEILGYMAEGIVDPGLTSLLSRFKTMFPYLQAIARANDILNPFEEKVVEAYWIGNDLLEKVGERRLHDHLKNNLQLHRLLKLKEFRRLEKKIGQGARMHHSFHVMNIWRRTGLDNSYHTLTSIDNCRISWGKVVAIDGPFITVRTQPLMIDSQGQLALGQSIIRRVTRRLDDDYMIEAAIDDIITLHWDMPCEIVSIEQSRRLRWYTLLSIAIANQN